MPVLKERDAEGVMQPIAKCSYIACETPNEPMPHGDQYLRLVDPQTGVACFEPMSVQLPVGWMRWRSLEGEELLICPMCIERIGPLLGLP